MNDRELRLRQRIDQLTDQRDKAIEERDRAHEKLKTLWRARTRIYKLNRTNELLRLRLKAKR